MRAREHSGSGRERARQVIRVIRAELPLPPGKRLRWWLPLWLVAASNALLLILLAAIADTLRSTIIGDFWWVAPAAAGILVLAALLPPLLEGVHAQRQREGTADLLVIEGDAQPPAPAPQPDPAVRDLAARQEMTEIQVEMILATLIEMCQEAGAGHLADKAILRLVRDSSRRPAV